MITTEGGRMSLIRDDDDPDIVKGIVGFIVLLLWVTFLAYVVGWVSL